MVTSFFELNHRFALITSLPALFLCLIKELVRPFVTRTLDAAVPFRAASRTDLGLAATATGNSPTIFTPIKACRFDQFTAAS